MEIWDYSFNKCKKCNSSTQFASLNHTICYENINSCENSSYGDPILGQCIACESQFYSSVNHTSCKFGTWNCDPGSYGNSTSYQCMPCENSI